MLCDITVYKFVKIAVDSQGYTTANEWIFSEGGNKTIWKGRPI